MISALETMHLGKRYGKDWALRDCTFKLPIGRVAGLVGPNGAGKTTLLHLAVGLLEPSTGNVQVFGESPRSTLPRIGFVAQDRPLYRSFSVKDMLELGHKLNPHWDMDLARERLDRLSIPLKRPSCREDRFLAEALANVFGEPRSDLFARNLELARVSLQASFVTSIRHHRIACGLRGTLIIPT